MTEVPLSSGRVFTAYLRDLTETKRAEREIARQREQLYHSEKLTALGSLLAGVAHELNNPLSVVVGQATLLEETAPDPRTAARGQKIRAAADRCAKIVKTFLAMARRRQPERAAVDLNEVVRSALELVGYGLHTADIKVELDLAEGIPDIWADPDQLNQVMTNLLVNAQHALLDVAEPRRLKVTTSADPSAGHLRVVVSDNGPGVPPEMRSRIFEPFFTTKPMGIGTGVGLSVCHGVVEAHGGTVSVEDEPGGGARFVVTLPLVAPPVCAEGEVDTPSASGGRRLLIVDDEPEIAQVLAEILSSAGHVVDVVDSGQAALDRLGDTDYDLIVSDIRMPNLDGPGLYRALLRKRPDLAARTIFITGDTLGTTAAGFLRQTRRPCIEKPFDAAEVRRVIEEALAEAPQEAV
ncbi:MAG: response regulator [Rhodospirillales bacterium]|nr:response regulator [Rhodospirillales bacterium]